MAIQEPPASHRYVGTRQRKHDGDAYLRGDMRYVGDVAEPGMVHVAVVRSSHAHARITSVDLTGALDDPSVLAAVDGEGALGLCGEIPHSLDPAGLGGNHALIRCLAVGKVTYSGEPVAAVVAETAGDALAAARRVRVGYEPLPVVLDVEEALADDAPLLYPEWGTNVIIQGQTARDDFEAGAARAPHRLRGELRTHRGNAAPMEVRAHVARWDSRTQRLTMHAATQNPHPLRSTLAVALGLREQQVHVIAPRNGGSFGLKMYGNREDFLVAALARLVPDRAVRWSEDRTSALLPSAREQLHSYEAAYDDDGKVHALKVRTLSNHGAGAPGHGWGMAFVGAMAVGSGYMIDCMSTEYVVVATNKAPWGGTKPFGKDGSVLLLERVMERVAELTGLDPVDVRRRNFVPRDAFPHVIPSGLELDSGDYDGVLDLALARLDMAAERASQEQARAEGHARGIGLAFEVTPEGADIPGALVGGYDTATVRMDTTGRVVLLTGVTTPGTGNDTSLAQIAADELGVLLEDVDVVQGDTDTCPYGFGNISSRSLVVGGGATALAARDVAATLRAVAGRMLDAEPEDVALAAGSATVAGPPARSVPIAAVAEAVHTLGYVLALGLEPRLEATRTWRPPNIRHVPDERGRMNAYATYPNCVHLCVVDVDRDTGSVAVRRHVVAHDCGTVVNPLFVDGQVTGGVVMGLSSGLGEELTYGEDGVPTATGFKSYLLARANDLPSIELEHQETPTPFTLLGAKGAGEAGFAGAQAALLNAVNDALRSDGVRLEATPVSPPLVLDALLEGRAAR